MELVFQPMIELQLLTQNVYDFMYRFWMGSGHIMENLVKLQTKTNFIQRIVHSKLKRLSSFTHSHVALTLFPLWSTKEDILNNVLVFFFGPYNNILLFFFWSIQWMSMGSKKTQVYIHLHFMDRNVLQKLYRFGTTWGWVKMTESYLMLLLLWTFWLVCDCTFCIATHSFYIRCSSSTWPTNCYFTQMASWSQLKGLNPSWRHTRQWNEKFKL